MEKSVGTTDATLIGAAPLKDLDAWARATENEIKEIQAELLKLEQRMVAARERLDLIRRLIGLGEGQQIIAASTSPAGKRVGQKQGAALLSADMEAHLEEILKDAGQPLHISALRDSLIQRGIPLPGRGDEANIIIRLRRDENRFMRTGRGTYALTVWGLPAVVAGRRKKVRRRRAVKP